VCQTRRRNVRGVGGDERAAAGLVGYGVAASAVAVSDLA
jgi:hypothetical protein